MIRNFVSGFLGLWVVCAAVSVAVSEEVRVPGTVELEPGDRGTMRTALHGNEIQEIPLRYLGTSKDFLGPGLDLMLVQLEGEEAENVGVAAGMSGSPVYFDGRLVGALSYRLGSLPRQPVGGVTPIADMLRASGAGAAPNPGLSAAPIRTPLLVGGVVGPVREWLAPTLEAMGFTLVGGGRVGDGEAIEETLRPGSPVGVELVRGDLAIAATGTVTWVEDGTVYAFGHPFMGSGRVEIPMVSARVIHTLADLAGSLKLANTGGELGAIVDDRLSAIVGRIGQRAKMIPMSLEVRGAGYGESSYRFELARIQQLTPFLAGAVVANALMGNIAYDRESTMFAKGRIRFVGLPDLPLEMAYTADGGPDPSVGIARTIQIFLSGLANTALSEIEVEAIEFEVDVIPEVIRYELEGLNYDRGPLMPGQTLEVDCVLRRFRGAEVRHRISVPIPANIREKTTLQLVVGSPGSLETALGKPNDRRIRSAQDPASLIKILGERRSAHRLTALLYRSAPEIVDRGGLYESLPPTAQRLLTAHAGTRAVRNGAAELSRSEIELDGPLRGGERIRLVVDPGLQEEKSR